METGGLPWEELAAIYDDHLRRLEGLATHGDYIANVLRRVPNVHTVRIRIKSPEHLVGKVLRKRIKEGRDIRFANYRNEITDLIGLRALHLYKEEWKAIHEFIFNEWELAEHPKAYIRDGDWGAWIDEFSACGCAVETHPRSYRSVHYLVKSAPSKLPVVAEIQVRTIFEEGWSEIDHRINYPVPAPSVVGYYLGVFNRLAGMADEMGSLLHVLVSELNARDEAAELVRAERDEALKRVEKVVAELEISSTKREQLQDELRKLRASTASARADTGRLEAASLVLDAAAVGGSFSNFGFSTQSVGRETVDEFLRAAAATATSIYGPEVGSLGSVQAAGGLCKGCGIFALLERGLCTTCRFNPSGSLLGGVS